MLEANRCSVPRCEQLAAGTLENRTLCRTHFISTCYERLERCSELKDQLFLECTTEALQHFIHECVAQATRVAEPAHELDNLERARLLDIMLWAGELGCRLRRSPRKAAAIPLRISSEKVGNQWEELTKMCVLSRHGALVECEHKVQPGETLSVLRTDTGRQALARVVWQQRKELGQAEIGVEFLDKDNFWELDWTQNERGPE